MVLTDPHRSNADPIVVELKTRMSLAFVAQATSRKRISESVYLAIPLVGSSTTVRDAARIFEVLKRLELGLLIVRFLRTGIRIEPVLHPRLYIPRNRPKLRRLVLREIDARYAELDTSGQAGDRPRFGAYKQRALLLASLLAELGECSPARLRAVGAPASSGRILAANLYGWYEHPARARYRVSEAGSAALRNHASVVAAIRRSVKCLSDETERHARSS